MAEHSTLHGAVKVTHMGKLKQTGTKNKNKVFFKSKWIPRIFKFSGSGSKTRVLKSAL